MRWLYRLLCYLLGHEYAVTHWDDTHERSGWLCWHCNHFRECPCGSCQRRFAKLRLGCRRGGHE